MAGVKRLTPEEKEAIRKEKAERLREKIKVMQAKEKQMASKDKQRQRKERARELIEIGAILCQFHDRKKLLAYLKNPTLYSIKEAHTGKLFITERVDRNDNYKIFISPEI